MTLTLDMRQRIGLELTPDAIARVETARELLHEVAEASTKDWNADRDQIMTNPESDLNPQQKRHLQPIQGPAAILTLALYWLNYGLVRLLFRLRIEEPQALPDGPFVMAPNHTSYLDPLIIAAALSPKRLRSSFWVAWVGAAFSNSLLRAISRLAQAVPIDPARGAISSLAVGAAILKKQHNLIWFPEAARSVDGELKPLRPGLGILLENFPVPVVPALGKSLTLASGSERREGLE